MRSRIHDSRISNYIDLIFDTFMELRGDRKSGDDEAVIGGIVRLNSFKLVVIGYQSFVSPKALQMPAPEGYRKCSRLIHLAESFNKPVIIFIDLPVFPPLSTLEQQRVNEAMASNLKEMSCLMTPIIGVIVGEFSGIAAIDLCAVDRVLMLEDAICSVPLFNEGSSNDSDTASLCLDAQDLLDMNVVHRTVKEPSKDDLESAANTMDKVILEELHQLTRIHPDVLVQQRLHRLQYQFLNFGTSKVRSFNVDNTI